MSIHLCIRNETAISPINHELVLPQHNKKPKEQRKDYVIKELMSSFFMFTWNTKNPGERKIGKETNAGLQKIDTREFVCNEKDTKIK